MNTGADINSRMKEAEVYHTMGLPVESLALYEGILTSIPSRNNDAYLNIQTKIDSLKAEIREKYPEEFGGLSTEDAAGIQEQLTPADDNAPAIKT